MKFRFLLSFIFVLNIFGCCSDETYNKIVGPQCKKKDCTFFSSAFGGAGLGALIGGLSSGLTHCGPGLILGITFGSSLAGLLVGFITPPTVRKCLEFQRNRNDIFLAIYQNNIANFKRILKAEPDILNKLHVHYGTVLDYAIRVKAEEIVMLIADYDFNPKIVDISYLSILCRASGSDIEYEILDKLRAKIFNKIVKKELIDLPIVLIKIILEYDSGDLQQVGNHKLFDFQINQLEGAAV